MWTTEIKSVFVPFLAVDGPKATPAVKVAISMADRAAAHLTVRAMAVERIPPYSFAPQIVGSLTAKVNADEKEALDKLGKHLGDLLKSAGFPHDVEVIQQPFDAQISLARSQARLHDISVIDAPTEYLTFHQSIFEELVFQSGRPVLVVPPNSTEFRARRIIIAWDGSPRAVRALNDAMPFLHGAEHVELTSVVNEKSLEGSVPGTEMAPQLARHGIKVEVVALEMKENAGTALAERAELVNADLIVAGAYAHSRWRHLVLGGVTTSLLRESKLPVLMSY